MKQGRGIVFGCAGVAAALFLAAGCDAFAIWPEIVTTNLPEMTRLHRKYGRRVGWQGSWCREQLQYYARQERAQERVYQQFAGAFR